MNQAQICSLMLAHNLIVYIGLIDSTAGKGISVGARTKTIRARIISIAAIVVLHARRLILQAGRVVSWQSLLRTVLGYQQHRAPS